MTTQDKVTAAILSVITKDIQQSVPFFLRSQAMAAAPALARECAIAAIRAST